MLSSSKNQEKKMDILEKFSKAIELKEDKQKGVQALMLKALRDWKDLDSHSELMKNRLNEEVSKIESREKKLESIRAEMEKREKGLDFESKKAEKREHEVDSREKKLEVREQELVSREKKVEMREKDVGRMQEEIDVTEEKLKKREIQLGSGEKRLEIREIETVMREENVDTRERELEAEEKKLKKKGKQLDSREEKLEIRKEETDLREQDVGRRQGELDLEEKWLKKKNDDLDSREKNLVMKENQVNLREEDVARWKDKLDAEKKKLKSKEDELGSRETELDRRQHELDVERKKLDSKQSELDRRGEMLEKKENDLDLRQNNLERRENETESKEREFEEKENGWSAEQKMFRERILDLELKFISIVELEPPEQFDQEPTADNRNDEADRRKRFRNLALASRRAPDAGEADGSNLSKGSCKNDKEAAQVTNHDLGESGALANYDIDKEMLGNRFNVGETWACFDGKDQVPRAYVQITEVNKKRENFKLDVAWLKPFHWTPGEGKWLNAGLPVGCGTFNLGMTSVELPNIFSHQVYCVESKGYGYCILPKAGETWAIYKDWDIMAWSIHPESHKKCKYEIVEVLCTEFYSGIRVAYMNKMEGHVKSYWQRSQNENDSFMIRPYDFYRFSHKVISARMNSDNADGFPDGTFEIEPKFLPPGL